MSETPFSGIRLLTWPGEVMTPRPATEVLVQAAVAIVGDHPARVADVGTGSGAVAVALALRAPNAHIWATDTSPAAVRLARTNVLRLGLADRVTVNQADLLVGVPSELDLVVANLPYLPDRLREERPELAGEPPDAVFAPGDGLAHYRRLLDQSRAVLRPDGAVALQLHRRVLVVSAAELVRVRSQSLAAADAVLASAHGSHGGAPRRDLRPLRQAVPRRGTRARDGAGGRQVPALQALHAARAG